MTVTVGFLNLQGARREQKWEELFNQLESEGMAIFGVAETHLRDLEEPPVRPGWHWAGCNRQEGQRRGGGVGVLWRDTTVWLRTLDECRDHIWVEGELLQTQVSVCIVYLSVGSARDEENEATIACVTKDIKALEKGRNILIMGDFNGHLHELDGWEDANGRRLLNLADEFQLELVNLRASCKGQYTWCARGSRTCIDYALVSSRLGKSLVGVSIDEEGEHSVGSDHNCLRLDFSKNIWTKAKTRPQYKRRTHLAQKEVERVTKKFERSNIRIQASGYRQYITELKRLIKQHSSRKPSGRRVRNRWWDTEVKEAILARQKANREHRQSLRTESGSEVARRWTMYHDCKCYAKRLTQEKMRTADLETVRDIRSSGRDAARKFWKYLGSLEGKDQDVTIIDESTGNPPEDLGTHLTKSFFFSPERLYREHRDAFELPEEIFWKQYRLPKIVVRWLCDELREEPEVGRVRTSWTVMTVELQVLCALRFCGTGSFQGMVASDEHVARDQKTVSVAVRAVSVAIVRRLGVQRG
ncbi:hypothetical protein ISCGN_003640 [Ixodes scapularis]